MNPFHTLKVHFISLTIALGSILTLSISSLHAQSQGGIKGKVVDAVTNESIPLANIVLAGTEKGVTSNLEGEFEIFDVPPGFQNLKISYVGYKTLIYRDILVTRSQIATVIISLEPDARQLEEFNLRPSPFNKTQESPVSLRTIGLAEIERNPGGNRDISNVLRSFPGVGSTPAFRNDIIIRGGAPSENRFFLDGVEVPLINHFQTQGASGGPVGIINVNLIREVDFLSSAFPANRGNALSSVLEFKQIDGNREKWKFRGTIGSSDAALAADGPIGKKASLIVSARTSYLQFLFSALKLPFLPTYYDMQFKFKYAIDARREVTVLGLGAIDLFRLNLQANETVEQRYQLRILPKNQQWNYTLGGVYREITKKGGRHTLVLSRSMLNNTATKYQDNQEDQPDKLVLDYASQEAENNLRYEFDFRIKSWKFNVGAGLLYARFTNRTYNRVNTLAGIDTIDFSSRLNLFSGRLFGQVSRSLANDKLNVSIGLSIENNDFNERMANPLNQFSPRASISYAFIENWAINASVGRFVQRPQYTVLGYGLPDGTLGNVNNGLEYIQADHFVGGLEYAPTENTRITLEGFYKIYNRYPFSLRDSVALANLGADFGVVGNVPANSSAQGRAYGLEFLAQQKLFKGLYGILAYTLVRSEFSDKNGNYIPSSWDARHILSLTAGYKFKRNWELGMRFRFVDGQPFTPYDTVTSSIKAVWDITQMGISDVNQLNSQRIPAYHQLDLRVDKVWYFKKWSLNMYLDIQNIYNFKSRTRDFLVVKEDPNGNPLTDPNNPDKYQLQTLPNTAGTVLPTIGLIVDF
jgi:hypothetical protein